MVKICFMSSLIFVLLIMMNMIVKAEMVEACECKTDTACETRCCDTPNEYHECGVCVEIDELERCDNRKKHHRTALYVMLALLFVVTTTCIVCKKKEQWTRKQKLDQLKI